MTASQGVKLHGGPWVISIARIIHTGKMLPVLQVRVALSWGAPGRGVPAVTNPRQTELNVSPWTARAATAAAVALPFSCAASVSSAAMRMRRGPGSPCRTAEAPFPGALRQLLPCRRAGNSPAVDALAWTIMAEKAGRTRYIHMHRSRCTHPEGMRNHCSVLKR